MIKTCPYLIPVTTREKNEVSMNESRDYGCRQTHSGPLSKSDVPFILVEVVTHACPVCGSSQNPLYFVNVCSAARSCHVKCEWCRDDNKKIYL